jgi:hypothetical protein
VSGFHKSLASIPLRGWAAIADRLFVLPSYWPALSPIEMVQAELEARSEEIWGARSAACGTLSPRPSIISDPTNTPTTSSTPDIPTHCETLELRSAANSKASMDAWRRGPSAQAKQGSLLWGAIQHIHQSAQPLLKLPFSVVP